MKKIFTLFTFLLCLTILNAQEIPNAGFESWEDFGTYMEPEFWSTPNPFTSLAGVITVEQSTDAAEGMYSARLETKDVLGGLFQAPGLLTLGNFFVNIQTQEYTFGGGIELPYFVESISGKFKYAGTDGDSASVLAYSFRHPEGEDPDTVAIGFGFLHDAGEWTEFTFPVIKISPMEPDSFNMLILSSGTFDLTAGSVLYIDDLSMSVITNVDELKDDVQVSAYPNPATDRVTFEMTSSSPEREVSLYDVTGRLVITKAFNERKVNLSVADLPQGMYTYRVVSGHQLLKAGSLMKQ